MRSQTITVNRAKRMRRALTPPELALWSQLKNRRLGGVHFRQHPLGPYILDFYCTEALLAVEIDGLSHGIDSQALHDARRDAYLAQRGVSTLRITASEVKGDLTPVLERILAEVRRHAPSVTS